MLDKMKGEAARSNRDEVELRDLDREAQANRTLYENFLQRFKETQGQDTFPQPDAAVISAAAVPLDPTSPQKVVITLLAAMTGLALGTLLALVCENRDVGVRSMEQVKALLGMHPLGLIPALPGVSKDRVRTGGEIRERPMSAYAEAIRTVYANFMLSDIDTTPKIVLVTSALPREGKSSTAAALAHAVAGQGARAVLVDCDLRHPTVHRMLHRRGANGLVDYLLGRAEPMDVIHRVTGTEIDVIPAGNVPETPPNLLGSRRFKAILQGLAEKYDMVILDSAPVLAVADTRVVSSFADKTIMVVRWATTSRKVAGSALEQLQAAGAQLAGVVLTQVDVKAHAKDGFADSGLYVGQLKHYYQ
jgi:capsular exopolysaccharide synthesis family protein